MFTSIRKRPLLSFYVLTFLLTLFAWLPISTEPSFLFSDDSFMFYTLAGFIPFMAAYLVLFVEYGRKALSILIVPLFKWNVSFIWYAVALLAPVWFIALSVVLDRGFVALRQILDIPLLILSTFLSALLSIIPEELVWRGFVLPRLQIKYSALISSFIIGLLWALWSIPKLLEIYPNPSMFLVFLFFIEAIAASVIYTWLFNRTKGSVLVVSLYRTLWETVVIYFSVERWAYTFVLLSAAVFLIIGLGSANLSPENRVPTDRVE